MPGLNVENRTLFHGDNLDFMRGLNSETVHLIATDPPFNKSRDFHATPDSVAAGARFQDRWSWRRDIHDDWLIQIQRDEPEVWSVITTTKQVYGDDMAAFLCFMAVRLLEMHRVLREDGSIYLHCDSTAGHYLKLLMDGIFGRRNFQSDITWQRTSAHSDSKKFGQVKDTLLFYTKSNRKTWNPVAVAHNADYVKGFYRHKDEKGQYRLHEIIRTASMGPRPNLAYEYKGYTPQWGWRMELPKLEALDAEGRLVWSKNGRPYRKTYLSSGQTPSNLWVDIPNVAGKSSEDAGFPTQKPLALYERIIQASSNAGDVVLDPFCGCATTPIAAERQGRQWIGIDIWDGAHDIVLTRLEREGLAVRNRRGRRGGGGNKSWYLRIYITRRFLPDEPMRAKLPPLCYGRRWASVAHSATRRPGRNTDACWWTWGRSVRVAGVTTALTLGCWKLTTSDHVRTAGPTPTIT